MRHTLYLALLLLMTACGYHLVGQGKATVIPDGVTSARLTSMDAEQVLLPELMQRWQQDDNLPMLKAGAGETHVTLRIEQLTESFLPIAFDASGLAIQYRLQLQAWLKMYQLDSLIWTSGTVVVSANVFGVDNPSVVEAERLKLAKVLRQKWAKEAMNRLKSGF